MKTHNIWSQKSSHEYYLRRPHGFFWGSIHSPQFRGSGLHTRSIKEWKTKFSSALKIDLNNSLQTIRFHPSTFGLTSRRTFDFICMHTVRALIALSLPLCTEKLIYVFPEMQLCSLPWSQFLHSYICEQYKHSQDWSACLAAAEAAKRSWEFINRSQTHECGNWEKEHYNSVLEIRRPRSFIYGKK